MARMVHGAVIRTFAQSDIEEFAEFSGVPTINALTDDEHPCQILGDIFTIEEKCQSIEGKVIAFVGDAASNTAQSWLFAAGKLNFELRLAAPKRYQPRPICCAAQADVSSVPKTFLKPHKAPTFSTPTSGYPWGGRPKKRGGKPNSVRIGLMTILSGKPNRTCS